MYRLVPNGMAQVVRRLRIEAMANGPIRQVEPDTGQEGAKATANAVAGLKNGRAKAFFVTLGTYVGTPAAIISMIVGIVAMVTVVYMAFATRARWAAEDEAKKPLIYLMPSNDLIRGRYRIFGVDLMVTPRDPVWISLIEIVEPADSIVARENGEPARRLEFKSKEMNWDHATYLLVHTPATPKSDQGTEIKVHFVIHVEASPPYTIDRTVRGVISENAAKD
jgi:hypothetical protein